MVDCVDYVFSKLEVIPTFYKTLPSSRQAYGLRFLLCQIIQATYYTE